MADSWTRATGVARRLVVVAPAVALLALAFAAGQASSSTSSRPTKAEIKAQTREAVQASVSRLLYLRVLSPNLYQLRVQVNDPAAFLKHRVNRIADYMVSHLPAFRSSSLTVVDRAGRWVFWIKFVSAPSGDGYTYNVRPALLACIDDNSFGIESNPDGTAPACPAH